MKYLLLPFLFFCAGLKAQTFDLVIRNGRIVDGSGNPWFYGDVAIANGKIVAVGKLSQANAQKTIDAKGLVIAPGFIDVHAHIEGSIFQKPTADNFIFDGVTTLVTGNCGGSSAEGIGRFLYKIDSAGTSVNVASLVGHNTVREAVMQRVKRDPSPQEQESMEKLVDLAMQEGAVGLSTGLIYVPGTYSKTPEVVGLAKQASKHGGVYASHMRSEGNNVTDAIRETITIGREASIPVEISHFKVSGKQNWGRSTETLAMVEAARKEGLDVTIDQYPYTASSTNLHTMLPSWVLSGGQDSVVYRLNDEATRATIIKEMKATASKAKMKNYDYAVVAYCTADTSINGKSISAITMAKGKKSKISSDIETVFEIIRKGGAQMVYHGMNEKDVQHFMRYPFNMIASDAGVVYQTNSVPHPRAYGTNARVLGKYSRELGILSLEEAIRRMTSLPAQKFNIRDRGLIREGMVADIVVFDPASVTDLSTFDKPHAYSTGFQYVLVNGQPVMENGKHNGSRPGKAVYGPGKAKG
ncbi:D-aminoacylase [Flavihumibacter rivuli]|uniref:N-acyl-D-amino-acid deacylase family protein n=1 Tax=Flavihumibacter rivuli TaxID=2838156 RepID=UPI001BDEE60D|nr:D-aminoacylase [Flavihumibacter rivuli]ULQ56875.1 D-aminoacylase [Flavihumibacter rivuli]